MLRIILIFVVTINTTFIVYSCKNNLNKDDLTKKSKLINELIDSLDTIEGWESYSDIGVVVRLDNVLGEFDKAMEINFDLTKGNWCAVKKVVNKNFSKYSRLKFIYFFEGEKNSLEIKLEDSDGTTYGYLIPSSVIELSSWQTVEIPLLQFKYWWGVDDKLNWKKIKDIHFAISKRKNDAGGSGKIIIDNIELIK